MHTAFAPALITHPTNTSATAPFSGVFTCSAKGHGKLNVIWHRHNKSLPQSAHSTPTASVNEITSTLTIPNVTDKDVGTYYCVVWTSNKATRSRIASLSLARKVDVCNLLQYMTLFRFTITTSGSSCSCSKSYC